MTKDISVQQLIETIKGKIPQSGAIASILSAAMGAALATKILEAVKSPAADTLRHACSTLQTVSSKAPDGQLATPELLQLGAAALKSLETIEQSMREAPRPLRSELLIGAMCCWTGLEGTLSIIESQINLSDDPTAENLRKSVSEMRGKGKIAGKSAEALGRD